MVGKRDIMSGEVEGTRYSPEEREFYLSLHRALMQLARTIERQCNVRYEIRLIPPPDPPNGPPSGEEKD